MWKTEGDQILYGPFDNFCMTGIDERELIDKIERLYIFFFFFFQGIRKKSELLSPFGHGHVAATDGRIDDLMSASVLREDEITAELGRFPYLNFDKYGIRH